MGKRAIIMAGGTGGHVFPAISLAQELVRRGWSVHWLGGHRGIETRAVPEAGFDMTVLGTRALRGQGLVGKFMGVLAVLKALIKALSVLRAQRPDLVVSLGGYTAGPGGLAARLMGVPLVLHEQNAVAGMTNKILAKLAQAVAQAFPNTFDGAQTTGNPVRPEILAMAGPAERCVDQVQPLRLLVFGGSQGAQALNEQVPAALAQLSAPLTVVHQAGRGKAEATRQAYQKAGVPAQVIEFIDDMAKAYSQADLVIGRAGALTVSELAAAGLPAILVPLPIAVDDHQTHNGRWLERAGAAEILPQPQLAAQLAKRLSNWLDQPDLIKDAAQRGYDLAIRDATIRLADLCESTAR